MKKINLIVTLAVFALCFLVGQAFNEIKPIQSASTELKIVQGNIDVIREFSPRSHSRELEPTVSRLSTESKNEDMARNIVYGFAVRYEDTTHKESGACGDAFHAGLPSWNTIYDRGNDLADWSDLQLTKKEMNSGKQWLFGTLANPSRVVAMVAATIPWGDGAGGAVLTRGQAASGTDGQEEVESATASEGAANYPVLEPTTMLLLGFCLLGLVAFGRKVLRRE